MNMFDLVQDKRVTSALVVFLSASQLISSALPQVQWLLIS